MSLRCTGDHRIVWMSLELDDLLARVVVEDPQLKLVTSMDEPVLPRDEPDGTDGHRTTSNVLMMANEVVVDRH